MGFLSKLWKGIKKGAKKIWKGVKKIGKKIVSGVKKVWDKFRKSGIGKAIMVAAAVYFGGVALGAWGGAAPAATSTFGTQLAAAGNIGAGTAGMAGIGGAAAPGSLLAAGGGAAGAAGGIAAAMPSATSLFGAAGAATPTAATVAGAGTGSSMAAQYAAANAPAVGAGAPVVTSSPTWVNPNPLPESSFGEALKNYGSTVTDSAKNWGSSALDWASKNPELTIAGGQALSAMTQDDPYDTWRKQREWERANSNIAGINGDGSGQAIGMGLLRKTQQEDLYSPTYQAGA
ncbi:MAG: hypothetical protein GY746_08965 [Gammaproteobacteria bacterium]|nr:hypothetical protein [Gammaproteobacteria bacterium]